MKLAYRTTWSGFVAIIATESAAKAKRKMQLQAEEANMDAKWIDIRVVRAPEYDGWAAVDKTGHCWAEENVPKGA